MEQDPPRAPGRVVHAWKPDGDGRLELVRYPTGGWWIERTPANLTPARKVKLTEAVDTAMDWWTDGGTPIMGRPGGLAFDREIYRRCRTWSA